MADNDGSKHDFRTADELIKAQKLAAQQLADEVARQERERQAVTSTLRDGMAKDQHTALGKGAEQPQPDDATRLANATRRYEASQRNEKANQDRLAAAPQEPERDPSKWLRDDQGKLQADRAADARLDAVQGKQQVQPAAEPERGNGYRAFAANVQPSPPETRTEQRQREHSEAAADTQRGNADAIKKFEVTELASRQAAAAAVVAEVERVQTLERSREQEQRYQKERDEKIKEATRELAAKEVTSDSRLNRLHVGQRAAQPQATQQQSQDTRTPNNMDGSRLAVFMAVASDHNAHIRQHQQVTEAEEKNTEQLAARYRSQKGEHGASRYSELVEMTDRRQAQASADKPSKEETEKIKQRANSGDGVKTKSDVGIAD